MPDRDILRRQELLLKEKQELLNNRKKQRARDNFIDFCQYTIKDESSGNKIKLAELQKSWIKHVAFCKANNLNCLILAPMSCHVKGHKILMYDGSIQAVETLKIGDQLMGPDSKPRTVEWLDDSDQIVADIIQGDGSTKTVSIYHGLAVYNKKKKCVEKKLVLDFIESDHKQADFTKYKLKIQAVDFPFQPVTVDPYVLGCFLGDGSFSKHGVEIVSSIEQKKPLDYISAYFEVTGENFKDFITTNNGTSHYRRLQLRGYKKDSVFLQRIKDLGLYEHKGSTKFIPKEYLTNSKQVRLQMLAGLLDTDGSLDKKVSKFRTTNTYDYISKSKKLAEGVFHLCRSLGIYASIRKVQKYASNTEDKIKRDYYRVYIAGNTKQIPIKISSKKADKDSRKDSSLIPFRVELKKDPERIYAFRVDKDNAYVSGEFIYEFQSGKCLDPKTPILTQDGYVAALEVEVGDKVLSYDEATGRPVWKPILAKEGFRKNCINIKFKSGRKLTVSEDHPFLTADGWVEAQDLRPRKDRVKTLVNWEYEEPLDKYTATDAYVLGCILGKDFDFDGTMSGNVAHISDFAERHEIEFDIQKFKNNKNYRLYFYQKAVDILEAQETDFVQSVSLHKRNVVLFFLLGYYDVLGRYNRKQKFIHMKTASKQVAESIQHMLQYVGVESKVASLILVNNEVDSLTQRETGAQALKRDNLSVTPKIQASRTPAVCLTGDQVRQFTKLLEIA